MARRQLAIPGTEPVDIPEITEAGEEWRDSRKEKKAASEREKQKKYSLIALMQAHKVPKYKYTETDTDEEVMLTVELEPKLRAKKTGEANSEVGEGLPAHEGSDSDTGPHKGLIAQAMQHQEDSNVAEDESGDVVVPDKASGKKPKTKRGGKKARNP